MQAGLVRRQKSIAFMEQRLKPILPGMYGVRRGLFAEAREPPEAREEWRATCKWNPAAKCSGWWKTMNGPDVWA